MVSIGDGPDTLNSGASFNPTHRRGGFKSDCITIGAGCTLGVNSLVHYGVKMGDGHNSPRCAFLMKGEEFHHTRGGGGIRPASSNDDWPRWKWGL